MSEGFKRKDCGGDEMSQKPKISDGREFFELPKQPEEPKLWGKDTWRHKPTWMEQMLNFCLGNNMDSKAFVKYFKDNIAPVLDKEIQKREEQRRVASEEARKQQQIQKEPFYRFGLAIAYGAHLPDPSDDGKKFRTEILSMPKETKLAIYQRLKNGEVPQPLRGYDENTIRQALLWLIINT